MKKVLEGNEKIKDIKVLETIKNGETIYNFIEI